MSGSEVAQRAPDPVRGKRGKSLSHQAQKAVDGDVAQQSATPWRDVLMGKSPDDRHTIQTLIAEVEQLRKLIQNNQAQSNS
ncbi:TPA: hypothetical protein ACH3X1_014594 [Trebouxia sp. C0004]